MSHFHLKWQNVYRFASNPFSNFNDIHGYNQNILGIRISEGVLHTYRATINDEEGVSSSSLSDNVFPFSVEVLWPCSANITSHMQEMACVKTHLLQNICNFEKVLIS